MIANELTDASRNTSGPTGNSSQSETKDVTTLLKQTMDGGNLAPPHTPEIEGFQRVDVVQDFLFTRVLLERIGACEGRKNAYGQDGKRKHI